ncbi:MAG: tRNA adenosine(34) deaminase TadA [Clostridia bacterium]|nr:tRNA adenosine(34) deaminase TadA [Clostridia bacterium]
MDNNLKENFMEIAYKEAIRAYKRLEVPVGAVLVKDGVIISKGYNLRETNKSSLAHAEIICIEKACKKLKTWRLDDCELYVTLEPCSMCAGAIIQSRIKKVYIGAMDEKNGAVGSIANMFEIKTTHKVEYETGVLKEKCSALLTKFFKELRQLKKKNNIKNEVSKYV